MGLSKDMKNALNNWMEKAKVDIMEKLDSVCKNLEEKLLKVCEKLEEDRKSTRLNSSHVKRSRMPSSA